ncbi:ExeM/NucH family extracellular endonuclease [Nocardioides stalactiti]|uniref:ExeM/NucH family extracellular endonuclease n=1 Tax=Nocardioides stalactiti TaxID=2755356 RepID=UPI0016028969|nr:ExeM/NucH family extracellular endonuclease [Nocardioides stalactiti]
MSSRPKVLFGLLGLGLAVTGLSVAPAPAAHAAAVSLSTLDVAYTQNFDTLSTDTATPSSTLPAGWELSETGTGANTTYLGGNGSSNSGNTYSFGATAASDRAFGGLQSGSVIPTIGASFTNATDAEITSLDVAYTGEQWRLGTSARAVPDRLDFQYSLDATSLTTGTWTDANALDFSGPLVVGTVGPLDGNSAANRTAVAATVSGLTIAPDATFWIRWTDVNASGSDDGLAVDDLSMTPHGAGDPEPTPLAVTAPGNKTGEVGLAIAPFTMAATGGVAPYTWSADGLPTGVSINETTGEVSGTPSATCTCSVTVTATDSAAPTAATDTETFTFTVNAAPEITPIAEIQGTGARSPFAPETGNTAGDVKTTTGVVTALYRTGGFNGMFIQTGGTGGGPAATPDASDALFIFGGTNAANIPAGIVLGDSVRVTGPVSEFFDSTQITPASPAAVVELGVALDPVVAKEIAYPTTDTGREKQEGMLLDPTDEFTVTNNFQTNGFAEIALATGSTPLRQPTEYAAPDDTAAIDAIVADNAARLVTLDDGSTLNYLGNNTNKAIPLPWLTGTASPPRVGAEASLVSPVILDWRNGIWKFQPRQQVTDSGSSVATFEDTRATNLEPIDVEGDITIATFNVLNFFNTTGEAYAAADNATNPPQDLRCTYFNDREGNRIGNDSCGVQNLDNPDTPTNEANTNNGSGPRGAATTASLARQQAKLVHTINTMDSSIIALEEMENSIKLPGETNRDDAVSYLVDLLNVAAGDQKWKFVRSPGEATTAAAVAEQDVIRPAFIYQPALVRPVGQSDILFGTTQFANAREPLAQAFKAAGAPNSDAFAVVVNHFKSKGDNASPAPLATGDNAAGTWTGAFNGDRVRQAQRLVTFADEFAAARDIEAVFLAGDFNSYTEEAPIHALEDGGYELIESTDDPNEESYSFSGLYGSLDHVLGNEAAMEMVTGADIWQINANESVAYQYSRYNYNATIFFDAGNPFATSDHNPEIVGLDVPDFTPTTTKQIQVLGTNDFHGRLLPDGGNAAGAAPFATAIEELRAQNPNTLFVAAGDLIGASTFESFVQKDKPTIDALNEMDLDVSSVGNHEFDLGYDDLVNRVIAPYDPTTNPLGGAEWEYIATNIDEPEGEDNLAESWVTTVDGVEIGFVGAVTEDLPGLVNPAGLAGVEVLDVVESVNAEAEALELAGADIIVLLVHEGSPTTDCLSSTFTDPATVFGNIVENTSPVVDAIISGHTHLAYNCRYTVDSWESDPERTVKRRPVVSAGQYGTNLNQLVFNLDTTTGELLEIEQDILATAGVGYAVDPDVQTIVDDAVDYADEVGDDVLGQIEGAFNRASYNSSAGATENRGGESTLGNQVAEIQRWATQLPDQGVEADIAFMNPGGLRADMVGVLNGAARDLTYREAANVQPFANTLVNMDLTGAQIETVLEQQWQRTATGSVPSRPFLRLGVSQGFTYTYVETPVTVNAPNAAPVNTFVGEVTGMWLDGVAIDPAATYSVTVNSFLGTGGDNFFELANGAGKVDTGVVDLQATVDYMEAQTASAPLPVDYSQRAVEVEFPPAAPATYAPGDTVTFDVASWTMSTAADAKDTELQAKDGDTVVDTATLDNTIGNKPYDNYGTATVSFEVPADAETGDWELLLTGASTGTEVPVTIAVERETTEIQVLGTNDFHGRLLRDETPAGLNCNDVLPNAAGPVTCPAAVLSSAVKQLRNENPNTVFAAAGDLIGATTFESFVQDDEPTIEALNEAGLEVSAAGNHEFDQGYEDLVGRVETLADWEYIAANVDEPGDRDDLAATWTKTINGIDVGFVGAVTEELPALVSPGGIEGVTVTDIVDATNLAAEQLKLAGAEIVILLVHEGSPSTSCANANFTDPATVWGNITQNTSSDVDAIISGHTHLAYNCDFTVQDWVDEGRDVTKRPVVSAGQYGQNLNKLVFTVDDATGAVTAKSQTTLALTEATYPEDPAVVSIVHDAIAFAAPIGSQVLGEIAGPFNRAKLANGTSENRGGESTLGNLVAEVQRDQTPAEQGGAQIAFMNPGGLRADMVGTVTEGVRELTYRQAAVVQPFANGLTNMDMTGAQIESALEQQWQRTADGPSGTVPSRPFLRLGVSKGFTYTYVETPVVVNGVNTFQGEVTGMWLNGVPIDPATSYSVTVNAFLATGGDNFRAFAGGTDKEQWGVTDLQAMVAYMAENTADTPLPVDYSQRAVEVHNVADDYVVGGDVELDVASWTMSTAADAKDTEVVVKIGDTELGTATLDNTIGTAVFDQYGTAHVDVPLPAGVPTGAQNLTLVGETTGTEVIVPVTIVKADSSVTGTDTSLTYGVGTTMHVEVSATGVTPTGNVVLSSGDVVLGGGTLSGGQVEASIGGKKLSPGTHEVTVQYLGDGSVKPSSTTATLTVTKATPTVLGTRTTVEYGKGTSMAVRVGATNVVPTGRVILKVGDVTLGTGNLTDGVAAASIAARKVGVGTHTVEITYQGDDFVKPGTATATLVVSKATPTVVGTNRTMEYGTASTMNVRVNAAGVVPTGRVVLKVGDVVLGTGTLADGVASATIAAKRVPVGTHTVTITYAGDELVKPGTATATLTVTKATPTVTGTNKTIRFGTSTTMLVRVKATGVVPTGRVVLTSNGVTLGAADLVDGAATVNVAGNRLPASATPYDVTIRYAGDGSVKTGTGTATLTVNP